MHESHSPVTDENVPEITPDDVTVEIDENRRIRRVSVHWGVPNYSLGASFPMDGITHEQAVSYAVTQANHMIATGQAPPFARV